MGLKKSKVSILIPTLGRETLYPLVDKLLIQEVNFDFEIVLVPQVELNKDKLKDKRIKIFPEELGKGFAYYRNVGIKKSKGDIVVFIDDDELPKDDLWLNNMTEPIIQKKEKVVTTGVEIKLKEGYLTDCVSLLGFPGGGAIGFETMWPLKEKNYTDHLCSGNLAILRKTLIEVGSFTKEMVHGNEDVDLAEKLIQKKIKIRYINEATVYHVARKGFLNFIQWNLTRGKSAGTYISSKKEGSSNKIFERFYSSGRILKIVWLEKTYYIPGVLFMMINQYVFQTLGLVWGKLR